MAWAADAYVLKRPDLGELKATIRRLLETRAALLPESPGAYRPSPAPQRR
jgi:hypothetical protein